jgi:hypothetical protein
MSGFHVRYLTTFRLKTIGGECSNLRVVKLEYLPDGSSECPLIRLYEFDQSEARQLRQLVKSMVSGDLQVVALQNEVWVDPVGGCCLSLRRGNRDQGIRQARTLQFECVPSPDGWSNVEGLIEPFCQSQTFGFQWLTHDGGIGLLISRSGQW